MNLRPALRALVESSSHSPVPLVTKSSALLSQSSSVLRISSPRSFSSSLGSSRPSQFCSCFYSSIFGRRFKAGGVAVISASNLKRSSGSARVPEASALFSLVSEKLPCAAFSGSAMSLSSEFSLRSLSLQNLDPEDQIVSALAYDSGAADEAVKEDVLVQYIVIRKDLVSEQNWPLGSIISQGCHAAVAAIWMTKDDPETALYCRPENLDHMHKVTLEVKGETQLRNLGQKLETAGIVHKLWIEQPENYSTCLATKPYYKSQVATHFKKLKLCK